MPDSKRRNFKIFSMIILQYETICKSMASDIADIIFESHNENSERLLTPMKNQIIPLNSILPLENCDQIFLNEEKTHPYEMFNFLVRQDTDLIFEICRKLTPSTTKEILKNVLKDPLRSQKQAKEITHEKQEKYYQKQRFALHMIRNIHGFDASNVGFVTFTQI